MEGNNGTPMYMPVAPANYGGGYGNGFGADGWWIILLLLFAGGGWGNGFGGAGNAAGFVNADVQRGFDQSAVMGGVSGIQNGITSGFGDVQTAMCSGFAGLTNTLNTNQMADLNRSFDAQTAVQQNFNALQAQLAQCCCDNRLATVQTQNIVQSEGAATRLAIQQQTQAILDKMCQQEIDALKASNLELQNRLNMTNLAASQYQQTQQILAAIGPAA